jgi:hypothetical protein
MYRRLFLNSYLFPRQLFDVLLLPLASSFGMAASRGWPWMSCMTPSTKVAWPLCVWPLGRWHSGPNKSATKLHAAGGRAKAHIAYWVGLQLRHLLPDLGRGPHTEVVLASMRDLATNMAEIPSVSSAHLEAVTSRQLYAELSFTLPLPPS